MITIPREIEKGKGNTDITILTENLCLAIFDKDTTGSPRHIYDINAEVFPQINRAYPEIQTRKQSLVYTIWAMKAICWNNRAKLVEQDWFENPNTPTDAINESLPEGSPWENRVPGKFGKKSSKQVKEWANEVNKAKLAVCQLRSYFPNWDNQKILDTLYNPNNGTQYVPRSVESAIHEIEGLTI